MMGSQTVPVPGIKVVSVCMQCLCNCYAEGNQFSRILLH